MNETVQKNILVVDDSAVNMQVVMTALQQGGHKAYPAISGAAAMTFLRKRIPDLILLDVQMPDMDGYQVITALKANPAWAGIPVIFLTSVESRESEEHALSMGAIDYITKPVVAGVLMRRVTLHLELESYRKSLEVLVEKKTKQLVKTQDAILDLLANVTAVRDNETGAHILRTTEYVRAIVETLHASDQPGYRMSPLYADNIIKSAKLHDIGKVAIADSILLKPDRLTPHEFERIKKHTTIGAMMIGTAIRDLGEDSAFLSTARELVNTHHECWDGSGYPQGLAGGAIPLSGRIMAIADVYDALISRRPYKDAFSHENAMFIITGESGTHFDKTLVGMCKDVFPKFTEIAQSITDGDSANDFRAW